MPTMERSVAGKKWQNVFLTTYDREFMPGR
jgi:hypothetical protein